MCKVISQETTLKFYCLVIMCVSHSFLKYLIVFCIHVAMRTAFVLTLIMFVMHSQVVNAFPQTLKFFQTQLASRMQLLVVNTATPLDVACNGGVNNFISKRSQLL